MPQYIWTRESMARLLRMRAEGVSAAAMAHELGGGLTRNAVLGKLFRLNRRAPPDPAPIDPVLAPALAPIALPGSGVRMLDLQRHHCRWPLADQHGADYYCGDPRARDKSYCPAHCAVAYNRSKHGR